MLETANPLLPLFAEVVLPLAVPQTYSYGVPSHFWPHIKVGQRVVVQFGKRKLYTGIVIHLHQEPLAYSVKPIEEIIDENAIVYPKQIEFWQWLSQYYMCTLGEVMNAAIPAGLKLQSQSRILLNKNFDQDWQKLSDSEFLILEALEVRDTITIDEAAKILSVKNPMRVLNFLLNKNAILLEEEVKSGGKAKMHATISLYTSFSETEINAHFSALKNAKKQHDLFLAFFALQPKYKAGRVPEKKLLQAANASKSSLDGLLKKQLLLREIDLIKPEENKTLKTLELSAHSKKPLQK